ncbi:MAG: dihydrofolate reductase [Alphaproteobacteria bacterium]|nr:dihydrofolate reductase [Alphaproteobacteria bacterium]
MRISLVVAVAANGAIGRGNDLPWRLPADLRHFKRVTMGKPVIMGRRTFESIGKPLPGRLNLVVSNSPDFKPEGVVVVGGLAAALDAARAAGAAEAMVIGGARLFAEALPIADRIHLTEVHATVEGDVFLPDFDRAAWRESTRERHAAAAGEVADYSFVTLDRR